MRYDLTPTEAAGHLGVHQKTLKQWTREGRVRALHTPGGHWRYCVEDLDAFQESLVSKVLGTDEP